MSGDWGRNGDGQFDNVGASHGQQREAGVNSDDDEMSARRKVEYHRAMNGLDGYTGLARPQPALEAGSSSYGPAGAAPRQAGGSVGGCLWALVKWLFLIPIALAGAAIACAFAAKSIDGGSLASRASAGEFADERLAPLTSRFSAKELATPVDPAELAAQLRGLSQPFAHVALLGKAYRCLFQAGCRAAAARVDPHMMADVPSYAAEFLMPMIAKGDESAAHDMCFLAIKAGAGYEDVLASANACRYPATRLPHSSVAREAAMKIAGSWALARAESYRKMDALILAAAK